MLKGLLRKVMLIAASIGLMVFGVTEWLRYEWANAPTRYPDGRVVHPDGRTEYPDGRVIDHGKDKSGRW